MNSVHNLASCFVTVHFSISWHLSLGLPSGLFHSCFPQTHSTNLYFPSQLPHASPLHSTWQDHPNNVRLNHTTNGNASNDYQFRECSLSARCLYNFLPVHNIPTTFSLSTILAQFCVRTYCLHNFPSTQKASTFFSPCTIFPTVFTPAQHAYSILSANNIPKNICLRNSWGNCHFHFRLSLSFCRIAYLQAFDTLQLEYFNYEPGSNTEFQNLKKLFYWMLNPWTVSKFEL